MSTVLRWLLEEAAGPFVGATLALLLVGWLQDLLARRDHARTRAVIAKQAEDLRRAIGKVHATQDKLTTAVKDLHAENDKQHDQTRRVLEVPDAYTGSGPTPTQAAPAAQAAPAVPATASAPPRPTPVDQSAWWARRAATPAVTAAPFTVPPPPPPPDHPAWPSRPAWGAVAAPPGDRRDTPPEPMPAHDGINRDPARRPRHERR